MITEKTDMTSMQPYLLRALFDWITDNGLTPYLLVNADYNDETEVPRQYVEDGKIILNISPTAVQGLTLDDDWVSFRARFSCQQTSVYFPTPAVLAIYARENGKGMFFQAEEEAKNSEEIAPPPPPRPPRRQKPVLRLVK